MSPFIRRSAVALAGAALTVGTLSLTQPGVANAAVACAAENQAVGTTQRQAQLGSANVAQKQKRLKKAQKAYRKHHSKKNKKKVKKARKALTQARRGAATYDARYRAAVAAANACADRQAAAQQQPVGRDQVVTQAADNFADVLSGMGLDATAPAFAAAVAPLTDQLGTLLDGVATQAQLDSILGQLDPYLAQAVQALVSQLPQGSGPGDIDPGDLQAALQPLVDLLTGIGAGLPDSGSLPGGGSIPGVPQGGSLGAVVNTVLGAIADSPLELSTLTDGLDTVLTQVTTALAGAGLGTADLGQVASGLLDQVAAGTLPSDLNGLVDEVGNAVQDLLTSLHSASQGGLPLDTYLNQPVNQITESIQAGLDQLLAGLGL